MNLHEECLLKYLLNPLGVSVSTELLKKYNDMILKNSLNGNFLAKTSQLSYSTNRT